MCSSEYVLIHCKRGYHIKLLRRVEGESKIKVGNGIDNTHSANCIDNLRCVSMVSTTILMLAITESIAGKCIWF